MNNIQTAIEEKNAKSFWEFMRGFKGKKQENNISGNEWVQHFVSIFQMEGFDEKEYEENSEIKVESEKNLGTLDIFTSDEILRAVNKLKNRKAPGEDEFTGEFFKEIIKNEPFLELFV